VKITELKKTALEEGFLDNLISKAQSMAGGDGMTGFVRALRGQGAALNRVADSIANQIQTPLLKRLGNSIGAIRSGRADVPTGLIVQLALGAAVDVSRADDNTVNAQQIVGYLKSNKPTVVQVAGGRIGPTVDSIVSIATGGKADPIANLDYTQTIKSVCLSIAAAIVLIQAEGEGTGPYEIDPAEKQKFEQLGNQVIDALFDPTSADFRALNPNENLKDNISALVIHIINTVQNKLVDLPADQLQAVANNPPAIVTSTQLKTLLAGHDTSINAEAVNNIVTKVVPLFQEQLKAWIAIALKETTKGRPSSFQLYKEWGSEAYKLIDNMRFGQGATAAGETPTAATTPTTATMQAGKSKGITLPNGTVLQPGSAGYEDLMSLAKERGLIEARRSLSRLLTEAKARIDHPEDLVFEEGTAGALRALEAIIHAARNPSVNTVKWDGTPAIIFGRDEQGFILTDKAGFGAKKYDGMARSQKMFQDMIFNRKPDEPTRMEYATQIAKLYPMLEKIVPVSFRGFIQGDIMWMSQPVAHDGVIEIQPLKVKYTINAASELGKKIKSSQAGVVVHSYFTDRAEEEPRAMTPEEIKKLKSSPGLVVLSPVMKIESVANFDLADADIQRVRDLITKNKAAIDKLLDTMSISTLKISNLPDVFKSFLNFKAYRGEHAPTPKEFQAWLASPDSKLTANKLQNITDHINKNKTGFAAVFQIANALVNLKYELKNQLDTHASQDAAVTASVREHPGHEGFVADTPHGKIKLVNRPVFMKKV
jgi:hypothetical protein